MSTEYVWAISHELRPCNYALLVLSLEGPTKTHQPDHFSVVVWVEKNYASGLPVARFAIRSSVAPFHALDETLFMAREPFGALHSVMQGPVTHRL